MLGTEKMFSSQLTEAQPAGSILIAGEMVLGLEEDLKGASAVALIPWSA